MINNMNDWVDDFIKRVGDINPHQSKVMGTCSMFSRIMAISMGYLLAQSDENAIRAIIKQILPIIKDAKHKVDKEITLFNAENKYQLSVENDSYICGYIDILELYLHSDNIMPVFDIPETLKLIPKLKAKHHDTN